MANFVFDGSQDVTITNFNTVSDAVNFINVNATNVRSFEQVNGSTQLVLNNGRTLTIQNVPIGNLTAGNLVAASASDLQFRIGTAGVDTVTGNVIVGFAGNDVQTAGTNGAIIYGNSGNDVINGTDAGTVRTNLRLYGGQGNDQITGFGTASVVYGGLNTLGVDTLTAATGAAGVGVTIYGGNGFSDAGDGDDNIGGSLGNDLLYGNGGNDTIAAGGGRDTIYGGQGNDAITAVGTGSVVYGGLNNDTITATAAADGVTIFGGNGFNDATDGADLITGSNGNDLLYGNGGNDTINLGDGAAASQGRDTVYGGAGDDSITGTAVADGSIAYGGNGSDTITLTHAASGTVTVFGGNGFSDTADGSDTIVITGAGAALVYGNGGTDNIRTGAGADTVFGGAGADTIDAGAGRNVVTGGEAADVFVATGNAAPGPVVVASNANFTTVTDFGAGDTIQFSEAVRGITQIAIDNTITTVEEFITRSGTVNGGLAGVDGQAFQFTFTAGAMAGTTIVGLNTDGGAGVGALAGAVDELIVLTGTVATLNGSAFTVG